MKSFLLVLTILTMGSIANAQALPVSVSGLDLSLSSSNPTPGQSITITAQSYSIDINSASVTWTVNGKVAQKGTGLTKLDVTAPALGKKLSVGVTAVSPSGTVVSGAIVVGSGSVDLVTETDGYVPPFFKGKFPVVFQNGVKIIAMPHLADASGKEYDPSTLIYTWKKNDQVMQDQSGYGRQSVTVTGDIVPRPFTVSVSVSTRSGNAQAAGQITISFQSPGIAFYEDDPLYGPLFNSAITGTAYIGSQQEQGILAAPFGFDGLGTNGLALNWSINGIAHPELAQNQTVVMRAPDGQSGASSVSLNISNSDQVLQGAQSSFNAIFNTNPQGPATSPAAF
ncbi:MAG: hypothetical protein KGI66_03820 [Patescibacteria group bacterium]|nr:hypothetical protein [Patescibacteria group bacterium]